MTWYVWEPVERVLRGMFYDVLSENMHPPSLREVWIDMDRPQRGDATVVAEFDGCSAPEQSHRIYQKVIHEAECLRESWFGLRRRARGRVRYEAHSLYSQIIENHLLERELCAARERLSALERVCVDPAQLAPAYAAYHRQCEHIQRNHALRNTPEQYLFGVDWAAQADRTVYSQQVGHAYDSAALNGLSALNTYSANNTATQQALTYEQMRNAYSALLPGTSLNDINPHYYESYLTDNRAWFMDALGSRIGTEEANKKGMALLKENLTPEQLQTYEKKQYFDVVGGKSGKTYRIHHGRQMNIRELDAAGKEVQGLCFLPQGGLVAGDCMLAQKNALELDEDKALKVANKFAVDGAPRASDMQIAQQQMAYEQARMQMLYGARIRDNRGLFGGFLGT